jgi:hypothetical protein
VEVHDLACLDRELDLAGCAQPCGGMPTKGTEQQELLNAVAIHLRHSIGRLSGGFTSRLEGFEVDLRLLRHLVRTAAAN